MGQPAYAVSDGKTHVVADSDRSTAMSGFELLRPPRQNYAAAPTPVKLKNAYITFLTD
jgi:hypothetical protein